MNEVNMKLDRPYGVCTSNNDSMSCYDLGIDPDCGPCCSECTKRLKFEANNKQSLQLEQLYNRVKHYVSVVDNNRRSEITMLKNIKVTLQSIDTNEYNPYIMY